MEVENKRPVFYFLSGALKGDNFTEFPGSSSHKMTGGLDARQRRLEAIPSFLRSQTPWESNQIAKQTESVKVVS